MSLYSHHSDGTGFTYSSRLRPITNMRPKLATRNPWQFMADTHLLDWLETKGFTVDIITDHDLNAEGAALLAPYKVVLTGTHPEYTSPQMHDASEHLLRQGRPHDVHGRQRLLLGHDLRIRQVATSRCAGVMAPKPGRGRLASRHHSLTGEPGGLWRFRGHRASGDHWRRLHGAGLRLQLAVQADGRAASTPRAAFIFEGIGKDEIIGDFPSLVLERGAGGSELDRVDYALGSPAHTLILAESYGHSDAYQQVVEEVNTSDSRQGGTENPLVYAHLAYFEHPNGGAVFSTGSIAWCGSLSYNNYTNNVSRMTENVLRRFASDTPLPAPPAGAAGRTTASRP